MLEALDKNQMEALIGKTSMFSQKGLISKVSYVSGVSAFEALPSVSKDYVNFYKQPKGLEVQMQTGFKAVRIAVPDVTIRHISFETKETILEKKEKSVLGRAVVGGVLLGPFGALLGGMSGMKDKTTEVPDNFITLVYDDAGEEKCVVFHCKKNTSSDVKKYFTDCYPSVFSAQ